MLAAVVAVVSVAACGGRDEPIRPAESDPLLALVSTGTEAELVRLDRLTLRPVDEARVPLGLHDLPWARSPDGSLLALGSGRVPTLMIVDSRRMEDLGELHLQRRVVALAWPTPDRLLAVVAGRCCPPPLAVLEIDARRLAIVAERPLGEGSVLGAASTGDGLVLLLGEHESISTARIAYVQGNAAPRSRVLEGVRAGWERPDPRQHPPVVRHRRPGLAADPDGTRAFVAESGGAVVEVALDTLASERHVPERRASLFRRVHDLLEPPASADGGLGDGQVRQAVWLGGGLLAVTGHDERPGGAENEEEIVVEQAGLRVIDTGDWSVRLVDPEAPAVSPGLDGKVLVAASWQFGLALYEPGGSVRLRLRGLRLGGVQVAGTHAYLGLDQEYGPHGAAVVDLEAGRVVSRPVVPGWVRLLGDEPTVCWC